jgi:trans-2,3-dihydro-3-hydroxyanthranilate isomerase
MSHRFLIIDVFTERPFGGNQLGVFPDARGLPDAAMQKLARELNFAETTFVLPPEQGHTRRVRIFTPRVELPFAGHPTLGTAAALLHEGVVQEKAGGADVVLEEKAGPVAVHVQRRSELLVSEMTLERVLERSDRPPDPDAVAAALTLQPREVLASWFAGLGVPFCFVELKDRAAVDRAVLDRHAFRTGVATSWAPQLFFFAPDPLDDSKLYARMFAPALGVDEDPATGSAAAALVASLAERRQQSSLALSIDQGVALGRPSSMQARVELRQGLPPLVRVSGGCVVVAQGSFDALAG